MFTIVRGLLALALVLVGIGLFRGWFSFSSPNQDPENHRINVNVSVNTSKVENDTAKAEDFTQKLAEQIKQRRAASKAQEVK